MAHWEERWDNEGARYLVEVEDDEDTDDEYANDLERFIAEYGEGSRNDPPDDDEELEE